MATRSLGQLTLDLIAKIGGFEAGMDQAARIAENRSRQIEKSLRSINSGFASVSASLRQVRSLFASFGVALSARAFVHWISAAVQAKDLTDEQVESVKEARKAIEQLDTAWGNLGRTIGETAAPAISKFSQLIDGLRVVAGGSTPLEDLGFAAKNAREEIDYLQKTIDQKLANPKSFDPFSVEQGQLEALRAQLKQAKLDLQDAEFAMPIAGAVKKQLEDIDIAKILGHDGQSHIELPISIQLNKFSAADFDQAMDDALFSSSMQKWIDDNKLELKITPEVDLESLEDAKKTVNDFAKSFGRGLHDSFVDFIVEGEANFKDFLRRMAAEAAASELFSVIGDSIGGGSGIGTFFKKLFGGSRATGGAADAGKVYRVHQGEAFFEPGRAGFVAKAGNGLSVQIGTINADDHVGVLRAVQEGMQNALAAAAEQTAAMYGEISRPVIA